MNHSEVRSKMPDYLEGELDLMQRALLDAHLDGCDDCSRDFAEMRGTIALLRGLPDPEPPPFLAETVMRRIRDGEGRFTLADRIRDFARSLVSPPVAIPATALALGLMMATGVVDPTSLQLPGARDGFEPGAGFATVPEGETRSLPSGLTSSPRPPLVARAPGVQIRLPDVTTFDPLVTQVGGDLNPRRPTRSPRSNLALHPLSFSPAATPVATAPRTGSAFRPQSGLTAPLVASNGGARADAQLENRLERMIHRPVHFAQDFTSGSMLEQEMWLRNLAVYAHEQGRAREALNALNGAIDLRARQVATAFAAELRRIEYANVASLAGEERPAR